MFIDGGFSVSRWEGQIDTAVIIHLRSTKAHLGRFREPPGRQNHVFYPSQKTVAFWSHLIPNPRVLRRWYEDGYRQAIRFFERHASVAQ